MFYFPFAASILSLLFSYFLFAKIRKSPSGEGLQIGISSAVKECVKSYLIRQCKAVGSAAAVLFVILFFVFGWKEAFGFLIGAVSSAGAVFVALLIPVFSGVRTAEAVKTRLPSAFSLSFRGGAATGFLVAGLGLLAVSSFYLLGPDYRALTALGLGVSLIAIFSRFGGEIFGKAAKAGADSPAKAEKGILENNPRNPAAIAAKAGDIVRDCAGTAGDMFQTYAIILIAAIILAEFLFPSFSQGAVWLLLFLASEAILVSIISVFFVKLGKRKAIMPAFCRGLFVFFGLSALSFFPVISYFSSSLEVSSVKFYLASVTGLLISGGAFFIVGFFASGKYSFLAAGMKLALLPIILILIGILAAYGLAGTYGLAVAAVSALSLIVFIIAIGSYGSISENAGLIAKMADFSSKAKANADALSAAGCAVKSAVKSYAIVSAGIAVLVIFGAYIQELKNLGEKAQFLSKDPKVLIGLFLGGIIAYLFCVLFARAVGKTAGKVIREATRQFAEIGGLEKGGAKFDYSKYAGIIAKEAIKKMALPVFLPILLSLSIGFLFGPEVFGGLLLGFIAAGIFLAIKTDSASLINPMVKALGVTALLVAGFLI